jgi:FkbM family methyltransferase
MSFFQGLRWYYDLCGIRGVCVASSFRLLGRPRELTIVPRGMKHPVRLRLGTSDFCAYKDVLVSAEKQYDPGIPGFSPRVIVDGGAHIGMASIRFACRYPGATIIAVEPEPTNFAALLRNVAPYKNVVPVRAALWKKDGEVCLGASDVHPKGAFRIGEHGPIQARGMTVRTLMRELRIPSIDLLKLDIEGAEKEVFETCDWIESVGTIAMELHDRVKPGCRAAVQAATRSFRLEDRGEVTFCFSEMPSFGDRSDARQPRETNLEPTLARR